MARGKSGIVPTKAGEALGRVVDPANPERRWSQSRLAKALGVSQPSVSEWVRMRARPESHLRKALERIASIPENDWMTDEERAVADGTGEFRIVESGPVAPVDVKPTGTTHD